MNVNRREALKSLGAAWLAPSAFGTPDDITPETRVLLETYS